MIYSMRQDIENIYSVLPFGSDIKYTIYNQMWKHMFTIPPELKKDLLTYFLLKTVINTYQAELETDYMDENYFLYHLYNDLIHEHHRNIMNQHRDSDTLFYNYYFEIMIRDTIQIHTIQRMQDSFLMKRIFYFWRLLNVDQRLHFLKFMKLKFN